MESSTLMQECKARTPRFSNLSLSNLTKATNARMRLERKNKGDS
jgi:hypothetical protein